MSWNIYFQAFTVRTWRKRLSNLNTFLTPHIYWGIHITICVNYNQHIQNQNTIKRLPRQVLQEQSKKLRRSIYEIDETMKEKFPDKNTDDSLEKELKYCKQLIDVIKGNEEICSYPKVQEKLKSTRRICH